LVEKIREESERTKAGCQVITKLLRSASLSATTLPAEGKKPQVPPLRCAPVGMTILLWELALAPVNGTNSRWHNKIVIPTGAYPDFLPRDTHQQPRMRLSVEKAALTPPTPPVSTGKPGERSGGTCGFFPSAGSVVADKGKNGSSRKLIWTSVCSPFHHFK
jgi:hypothetical protein